MRILLSIAGLLVVVAVVGLLARQQLAPTATVAPSAAGSAAQAPDAARPSQQLQQQYKQMLEGALQQPRPTGDDTQ